MLALQCSLLQCLLLQCSPESVSLFASTFLKRLKKRTHDNMKRHVLNATVLLLASTVCLAQNVFIGNEDTIKSGTFQAVNPDPNGTPLAVTSIGVEWHVMDMDQNPVPIDLEIHFLLWAGGSPRNLNDCVRWFNRVQARELSLDIDHLPRRWDGNASPWPYLAISIAQGAKQIFTHDLNGNPMWLWDAKDVQCWEVMDWRAPYFPNL